MTIFMISEEKKDLLVESHGGIPINLILNIDKLQVIEDLIKCPICFNYLSNPYEYNLCGSLFCEDCIQDWLKNKPNYPMRCQELKIKRPNINACKSLNVIELLYQNHQTSIFQENIGNCYPMKKNSNFKK